MSKKTVIYLALLILSALITFFLWPSDESRIKKLFREGAKAIEQEKIDDVMSKVSFNYTDEQGLTYLFIKKEMGNVFQQMSGIKIEYEIISITVKDATAAADLDIRVIASYGQDTGYVVGDAAKPAHTRFFLEKERTKWLVSKTNGV
ncbi:MAG: hypothetical protein CVV37_04175 [Nitrospira bacterium HGW-Nitrospira-1]|nr:MAG: hypothetical protein CVV37_04175 [Nitrospira bacterium HGW-Nitrospira-1]